MSSYSHPGINPEFLTGLAQNWPLNELHSIGYRALELTPRGLDSWEKSGDHEMGLLCVNSLPVLITYISGSLSGSIEWRRRRSLERLSGVLERMRKLEVPFLVVAPGKLAEIYQTEEEARELLISSLVELAEQGPTWILIESAPYRLFSTSDRLADIIDDVDKKNVGAALDVGHCMMAGEEPLDSAQILGDRLKYVQIRDVEILDGIPPMDRHLPLGEGSVDTIQLVELVGRVPWSVTVCAHDSPLEAARGALKIVGGRV
jgi:sugar phosphate isomerase/epimerase